MRGKTPVENLLFDPEIEKTARKNNSKNKRKKKQAKQRQQQEGTSVSISSTSSIAEEIMTEQVNPPEGNATPCHNSPRRLAHLARPRAGARQTEMKTGYLQLLYANPFAGLPHEDPYNHLVKF